MVSMCGHNTEGHLKFPHLAFPRLVLRKSPSQTLAPLAELEQLLTPAANHATVAEGRLLVRHAAVRIQELGEWVKVKAGDDLPELAASRVRQLCSQQFLRVDQIRSMDRPFWYLS